MSAAPQTTATTPMEVTTQPTLTRGNQPAVLTAKVNPAPEGPGGVTEV